MTPTAVRDRPGPVYDLKGKPFEGHGIKVTIEVTKNREADMAAGELDGPRRDGGRRRGTDGQDGRLPRHGPARRGVRRVRARLRPQLPVRVHPVAGQDDQGHPVVLAAEGFVPETLVMDGGAGPKAAWLLK